jgi:hypothetical protein
MTRANTHNISATTPYGFVEQTLRAFAALSIVALAGCGTADDPNGDESEIEPISETCSGHGEFRGGRCVCDANFVLSEDQLECLPEQDDHEHHSNDQWNETTPNTEPSNNSEPETEPEPEPEGPLVLDFTSADASARVAVGRDGQRMWAIEANEPGVMLIMESFASRGGPTTAGTFAFTEDDRSFATCGLCLRVSTGCVQQPGYVECEQTYMPDASGSLAVTEMGIAEGELWSGTLSEMVLRPVDIDPITFETTLTPDADTVTVAQWGFSEPLRDVNATNEPCGGHGHLHGDHCHCDPGYRVDPDDKKNCIPS